MLATVAKESSFCCLTAYSRSGTLAAAMVGRRGLATGTSRVVELRSDEEYQRVMAELAATNSAASFNFTAKWCGPCKMIAPLYDKLSTELPHVRFYKVDIDRKELHAAVEENGVVGVPNFAFYRGGERVGAFRGAKKDQLLGKLQQLQVA